MYHPTRKIRPHRMPHSLRLTKSRMVELNGEVEPIKHSADATIRIRMTNLSDRREEFPTEFHFELFSTSLQSADGFVEKWVQFKLNRSMYKFPLQWVDPNKSCLYEFKLSIIKNPTIPYTLSITLNASGQDAFFTSNRLMLMVMFFIEDFEQLFSEIL